MRKILALSALLAVAAFWTGCSADKANRPNTATTNSAAPATGSAANTNRSTMNSAPMPSPTAVGGATSPSGIKPPMKDEKAKK